MAPAHPGASRDGRRAGRTVPVLGFFAIVLCALAAVVVSVGAPRADATGENSIELVDAMGTDYSSLQLDAQGFPVISYKSAQGLKIAHCNDVNCAGGDETITSPDPASDVVSTSLQLDANGSPVVSYANFSAGLKLLHCNDPNCAGGDDTVTVVDASAGLSGYGSHGWGSSLVLDWAGNPVISYWSQYDLSDTPNASVDIVHCNDPYCTGGGESFATLGSTTYPWGSWGESTDLALDSAGNPIVAYGREVLDLSPAGGDLITEMLLVRCNDVNCTGGDESSSSRSLGSPNEEVQLSLDGAQNPLVAYSDGSVLLAVLHCNDPACAGTDNHVAHPDPNGWSPQGLVINSLGRPVLSYSQSRGGIQILTCGDSDCETGNVTAWAYPISDVYDASLQLDSQGRPVVSTASSPHGLSLVHCSTPTCSPPPTPTPTSTQTPPMTATETPTATATATATAVTDADGDGFVDLLGLAHTGPANLDHRVDNCPGVANSNQLNSDGNFIDNSPPYVASIDDKTLAYSDVLGDACDLDDDNDGIADADEVSGPECGLFVVVTDPMKLDTDGDRVNDRAECVLGSDPTDPSSRPAPLLAADDYDADGLSDAFEGSLGTNPAAKDTDGDGLQDGWEYKAHGTNALVTDSDADGVTDGCEVTSINGDTVTNPGDQALLAAELARAVPQSQKLVNFDLNRDGAINPGDQAFQANKATPDRCPLVTPWPPDPVAPAATATPTSTPTPTWTSTPTSTPSPTVTATPTPTSTFTPTPTNTPCPGGVCHTRFELYIDCDIGVAGIQASCSLPASTTSLDVGIIVKNNSGAAVGLSGVNFTLIDSNQTALAPTVPVLCTAPSLDCNPDFAQAGFPGGSIDWACAPPAPSPDQGRDEDPTSAESFISCWTGTPAGSWLPDGASLLIATVHYTTAPGVAALEIRDHIAWDDTYGEISSCAPVIDVGSLCAPASVQIGP